VLSEYVTACGSTVVWARDVVYAGGRLLGGIRATLTPPTVSMVDPTIAVSEGAGSVAVEVRLTTATGAATTCPVTVGYQTAPGTRRSGRRRARRGRRGAGGRQRRVGPDRRGGGARRHELRAPGVAATRLAGLHDRHDSGRDRRDAPGRGESGRAGGAEIVLGLGPGGNGWLAIHGDAATGSADRTWDPGDGSEGSGSWSCSRTIDSESSGDPEVVHYYVVLIGAVQDLDDIRGGPGSGVATTGRGTATSTTTPTGTPPNQTPGNPDPPKPRPGTDCEVFAEQLAIVSAIAVGREDHVGWGMMLTAKSDPWRGRETTGFRTALTVGQGSDVYRHIVGHAGSVLAV
jgi:hypothetical protein